MPGITPINGPTPTNFSPFKNISRADGQDSSTSPAGFDKALKGCIEEVNADQQTATGAVQELLTGKNQDIMSVVAATAKADMSFKLLIGVRNKVIEAYKQTLNMQI
ncbi:MAG: flagellar hook-basal body complex protein FliE [Phycisphaerae bacterium]|nr:flagellar hook-basal body complex protein FliE [Phycisphaerae bacterium]